MRTIGRLRYTDVANVVPEGEIGLARIVHDTPSDITRMRAAFQGQPLYQDKYVRLFVDETLYMTDAEFERDSNRELLRNAHGDALVAGLGIGLILHPLLELCESVTVIEKHEDVISLVGPHFPECNIVHADINDWKPPKGQEFDTIYFDIWPEICGDDKKEAAKLERRFRRYLREGGYMQSWTRIADRMARR